MQSLFFTAILPPKNIYDEIVEFKQYAADHFETKKALTSPPHIAIQPPFKRNIHDVLPVQKVLKEITIQTQPFEIALQHFQAFPPRVIYVDVNKTLPLFDFHVMAQQTMKTHFHLEDRYKGDFKPHITVAYRDLNASVFPKAWKYFSKIHYKKTFQATHLTLFKHNGKIWEVFENYPFEG